MKPNQSYPETPPPDLMPEDFDVLVHDCLAELSLLLAKPIRRITREVAFVLEFHTWPGKMCELRSALEYAAVSCASDQITWNDLPLYLRQIAGAEFRLMHEPQAVHRDSGRRRIRETQSHLATVLGQ